MSAKTIGSFSRQQTQPQHDTYLPVKEEVTHVIQRRLERPHIFGEPDCIPVMREKDPAAPRRYWLSRAKEYIDRMQSSNRRDLLGYLTYSSSEKARLQITDRYSKFLSEVRFIVENDLLPLDVIQLLNIQIFDPRLQEK